MKQNVGTISTRGLDFTDVWHQATVGTAKCAQTADAGPYCAVLEAQNGHRGGYLKFSFIKCKTVQLFSDVKYVHDRPLH